MYKKIKNLPGGGRFSVTNSRMSDELINGLQLKKGFLTFKMQVALFY